MSREITDEGTELIILAELKSLNRKYKRTNLRRK